jgi:hypothetical protein
MCPIEGLKVKDVARIVSLCRFGRNQLVYTKKPQGRLEPREVRRPYPVVLMQEL